VPVLLCTAAAAAAPLKLPQRLPRRSCLEEMNTGPGQALDLRLGLTKSEDVSFPLRWGIIGCGNISACWCESSIPRGPESPGHHPCTRPRRSLPSVPRQPAPTSNHERRTACARDLPHRFCFHGATAAAGESLSAVPGATVMGVSTSGHNGDADLERALDFVSQWGSDGCTAYNSYDELVANADIDIIYIGTKTKDHCEHSLLAIVRPERVEP
jgi:predicted dehydrogenase